MNIGIDLDNVLADFASGWLTYLNQKYKTSFIVDEITSYETQKMMGIDDKEFVRRVRDFYRTKLFENLATVEHTQKVIPQLSKNNSLTVITARPTWLETKTRQWIDQNFKNSFSKVILSNQFSSMKSARVLSKSEICLGNNISLMVEDSPDYTVELSEKGIDVFLLDKPWNRDMKESKRIKRFKSWVDIYTTIMT